MCDDINLIDRALNELTEGMFLRDLNHSGGMRLTADGQTKAETLLGHNQNFAMESEELSGQFDFFL